MYRNSILIVASLALLILSSSLRAEDASSNPVIVQFNKSLAAESESRYAEALTDMESLPADAKNDYLVTLRLGWLTYLNQDYDRSASYYQQADQIARGRSVEALLGLTLPLAAKSDWGRVQDAYRRILVLDPKNYTANLRLGQIELNSGAFQQADRHLKTALENFPGEYEANLSSAWNDYYLGNMGNAKMLFERALMISPGDTSATRGIRLVP
jgi:tetratricopeptide (TPR) repeat protein